MTVLFRVNAAHLQQMTKLALKIHTTITVSLSSNKLTDLLTMNCQMHCSLNWQSPLYVISQRAEIGCCDLVILAARFDHKVVVFFSSQVFMGNFSLLIVGVCLALIQNFSGWRTCVVPKQIPDRIIIPSPRKRTQFYALASTKHMSSMPFDMSVL